MTNNYCKADLVVLTAFNYEETRTLEMTITAADKEGSQVNRTVTLTVIDTNDKPTVSSRPSTVNVNVTVTANVTVNVNVNATVNVNANVTANVSANVTVNANVNVTVNVNDVLTCTIRASCYSTRLSWAHTPVINWAVCLGQKEVLPLMDHFMC